MERQKTHEKNREAASKNTGGRACVSVGISPERPAFRAERPLIEALFYLQRAAGRP